MDTDANTYLISDFSLISRCYGHRRQLLGGHPPRVDGAGSPHSCVDITCQKISMALLSYFPAPDGVSVHNFLSFDRF